MSIKWSKLPNCNKLKQTEYTLSSCWVTWNNKLWMKWCKLMWWFVNALLQTEALRIVRTIGQVFDVCHKLTQQVAAPNNEGSDAGSERSLDESDKTDKSNYCQLWVNWITNLLRLMSWHAVYSQFIHTTITNLKIKLIDSSTGTNRLFNELTRAHRNVAQMNWYYSG